LKSKLVELGKDCDVYKIKEVREVKFYNPLTGKEGIKRYSKRIKFKKEFREEGD